ncbi:roadblock/LC7 domain-containing protein [Actinomadura rupiterrae]|uniref:roadblock/LC7 domain-containing protein n=1 Tax=Actinomadura rupiterrae TaxID=559627 RepID=UPI0020A5CC23|nr:roadblock/LC7 domain-containing protein [Actinomadura rupiterrae]MCP2338941.1 putative regulator of Ras-like GTPase activity (Roadblock/LC7/MglB family) [Actinomadura rupiterrae]
MTETAKGAGLDWLMNDLVRRTAGARHAVLLSSDGLLMAGSAGLTRADAEHLSALGSAYRSLSLGAGRHFGLGGVRQTVVELEHAYVLISEAGARACLALIADEDADLGLVAYEMNSVVRQAGPHLSSRPRPPHGATAGTS